MLWGGGTNLFFCILISSCPGTICWRDSSCHIEWSWCIGLFLDSQFYCNSLYVYPYASIMLFWLLSFWNKFWNCEVCSSKFDFLFQSYFSYLDPRSSIWIWGLAFPFQKKRAIGISIGIGLYWICRSLWGSIDILMFSLLVLSIPWIFDRIFLENPLDLWGFFWCLFIGKFQILIQLLLLLLLLCLPIYDHGLSLHLFRYSLISFSKALLFLVY